MLLHFIAFISPLLIWSALTNVSTSAPTFGFCGAEKNETFIDEHRNNLDLVGKIRSQEVLATTFSEDQPVSSTLFGQVRELVASEAELEYYEHPRVITGDSGWEDLISRYADEKYSKQTGTWSHYFRSKTLTKGPFSRTISTLYKLEQNGSTAAYDGRPYLPNSHEYEEYRKSLKPMADYVMFMNPLRASSLFFCAFWAEVSDQADQAFLSPKTCNRCITAAVAWAKILLAHRVYFCNPACPLKDRDPPRSFIWNTKKIWEEDHDLYSAGSSLALAYDILYGQMSDWQRTVIRSALALLVMNRWSWGTSDHSSKRSPDAFEEPHRIVTYKALRDSNLYITNLAIEGEDGFDSYTSTELSSHGSTGFNIPLHVRFTALIKAYLNHAIYPDGSSIQDESTYFYALREGSLALIASHRRGSGVLDTARFRNLIHNAAQMTEPKSSCGNLLGHSKRTGNNYNSYVGLFKYAYPNGELPAMLWRQRFGKFDVGMTCRSNWWQVLVPLAFMGSEHTTEASSVEGLSENAKKEFPLSFYATRRGLLIARDGYSDKSSYLHFDARPDAFFFRYGHADRGAFTLTSLEQTWFTDLPQSSESQKHSLLHVDGFAQAELAPSVKMLRVTDNKRVVLAAADLTYAYNYHWATHWNYSDPPQRNVTEYDNDGKALQIVLKFDTTETSSPWSLGWPEDDKAEDIGFTKSTILHGASNIGIQGLWLWKRKYRSQSLHHMVRSVGLIRSTGHGHGVMFFVDSVDAGSGSHTFDSNFILAEGVMLDGDASYCDKNFCQIKLKGRGDASLDMHVFSQSQKLSFHFEWIEDNSHLLIVQSKGLSSEEIWVVCCPHEGDGCDISFSRLEETVSLSVGKDSHRFEVDKRDHGVVGMDTPPMIPFSMRPAQVYGVGEEVLHGNKETFLHRNGAPWQVIFTFTALSGQGISDRDEIATCNRYTTMKTHIAIYDCGPANVASLRYLQRKCDLISETNDRSYCALGSQQSSWSGRLSNRHMYYAAISGYPVQGVKPRFTVTHVRRIGR